MIRLGLGPLKSENRPNTCPRTFLYAIKAEFYFAYNQCMELKIIQKEYFELVVLINKSNKVKNEKTKLTFKVIQSDQTEHLYATTLADSKICLATSGMKNFWQVTGFSGLFELEKFLIKILNENSINHEGDYTELILEKLFPKE